MISLNPYAYPGCGVVPSHASPLVDCTSAIQNSDNINNAVSHTAKPIMLQEHLNVGLRTSGAPQTPKLSTRRTNDPYNRLSSNGQPCVPQSAMTSEMSFIMSYTDEGKVSSGATSKGVSCQNHQNPLRSTQNNSNCNQFGGVKTAHISVSQCRTPHVTHGHGHGISAFVPITPSAVTAADPAPVARQAGKPGDYCNNGTQATPHSNTARAAPTTSTSTTSIMRVPCKRVYVNGRPVIVSLSNDE
ncbi:hypothetical protein ERJ75_000703100 [Trypanosoma vivax]|uniref:Uncharacterized protein n=1 Tax=Trypanosoma vivax (strain Y486) TaxID=1055687 RepID=G0TU69_TRYVY|nr:hypothetical protein TRVL_02316 [Trypanosoma vivax]KAH8614251.1 hypothetical protein ERJ75_000703100 [Trypanosoma vivax]CCC47503.1 conserved hypothetical protein [Trypanosoma vivax Y486]